MWTIINVLREACRYIFTSAKAPYGFWVSGNNSYIFEFVISVFLVILMSCVVFIFFKNKKHLMWIPSKVSFIAIILGFIAMFVTSGSSFFFSFFFSLYMVDIFAIYSILCGCVLGIDYLVRLIIGKIKERKAKR